MDKVKFWMKLHLIMLMMWDSGVCVSRDEHREMHLAFLEFFLGKIDAFIVKCMALH